MTAQNSAIPYRSLYIYLFPVHERYLVVVFGTATLLLHPFLSLSG